MIYTNTSLTVKNWAPTIWYVVVSTDSLMNQHWSKKPAFKPVDFQHRISFVDKDGVEQKTVIDVKDNRLTLRPTIVKVDSYPEIPVTFLTAVEAESPKDREPICWTFITNLPIKTKQQAIETIGWYKQRWKIEVYINVFKSGLKLEESPCVSTCS